MIRNLAQFAWHLDEWLQEKLGRPYNFLLGVGIVLGLIHQIGDLPKDLAHIGVSTILIIAMDLALLINQAGQFHQHLERRKTMPKGQGLVRRALRRGQGRNEGGKAEIEDRNEEA